MENVPGLYREEEQMDLPPGFRFHPTDEELISHYLHKRVTDSSFSARAIGDVDLNKSEPWELPCKFSKTDFLVGPFMFSSEARIVLNQVIPFIQLYSAFCMKGKRKWERKSGTFSA